MGLEMGQCFQSLWRLESASTVCECNLTIIVKILTPLPSQQSTVGNTAHRNENWRAGICRVFIEASFAMLNWKQPKCPSKEKRLWGWGRGVKRCWGSQGGWARRVNGKKRGTSVILSTKIKIKFF